MKKMAIASLPKVAKYYHTHRMGAHRERIAFSYDVNDEHLEQDVIVRVK